jgi:dihydromethanopterin reductase (acceptor)
MLANLCVENNYASPSFSLGYYIEECVEFLLSLPDTDLYLTQAGEEVLKMYGVNLNEIKLKMPVYRDKSASAPPVGLFYTGYYHTLVMAPTTSNTVAKCVLGIADSLATNLYSQAGKCRVPSIVYPCDTEASLETTAPGKRKVMVYPRPIDLDATDKLRRFPYTQVVDSVDQLKETVMRRLGVLV